jgi:hypothetical protein
MRLGGGWKWFSIISIAEIIIIGIKTLNSLTMKLVSRIDFMGL